jgi:hypothetical protein
MAEKIRKHIVDTDPRSSIPETEKRLWREPGGELEAMRESKMGANGETEGHSELVTDETPETTRHLSDARIMPHARRRPGSVLGPDAKLGSENKGRNQGLGNGGRFSERGR